MSISAPFIERPTGTTLLTIAIALAGTVAYQFLPTSPIPQVEFPTIAVNAALPGASPETMASAVATPLERQFGRIAGITEMTSTSFLGFTSITLQFDLGRNIDAAARDVQAAINAARGQLPANLPSNPSYRKVNPADSPILILAMTSDIHETARLYDVAASIVQQKLAQIQGVGQVFVGGGSLPAVRVDVNPTLLNNYGLGLEDIRAVLAAANANRPKGELSDGRQTQAIATTDQLLKAEEYRPLVVTYRRSGAVLLRDVATVTDSVEDLRTFGMYNGKTGVQLVVFRQPGANMIETVDRVLSVLPDDSGGDSAGHEDLGGPRPHHHHSRLDPRHSVHHGDLDRAGDPGGLRLPAQRAHHHHPQHRRAGDPDRHLRRDVPAGLQHRQPLADGADRRDRVRRRRRHRGDREYHPPSGGGHVADAGDRCWARARSAPPW